MLMNSTALKACSIVVLALTIVATVAPSALACTIGDENRAIALAKLQVDVDRETHIFVAVAQGDDCDDWVVYKRTPGLFGVTACIITIEDWQVVDVTCCPTGC